jgi:hypothetical protein
MILKTEWPWGGLFPTSIEVTPQTVEITYRQLLGTSQQITIELREIHSCEVDTGIFFSSLTITYGYEDEKIQVSYLDHLSAVAIKNGIEKLKESLPNRNTK